MANRQHTDEASTPPQVESSREPRLSAQLATTSGVFVAWGMLVGIYALLYPFETVRQKLVGVNICLLLALTVWRLGRAVRQDKFDWTVPALGCALLLAIGVPTLGLAEDPPRRSGEDGVAGRVSETDLVRTPSLGLEFWQDGTRRPMSQVKHTDGYEFINVEMRREAFEVRFPKLGDGDTPIMIVAWFDASVFTPEPYQKVDGTAFCYGCGMATQAYGDATLTLSSDAHNAFGSSRPPRHLKKQDALYFSAISSPGSGRSPLSGQEFDIYTVFFFDRDVDGVFDVGEVEFVVLDF